MKLTFGPWRSQSSDLVAGLAKHRLRLKPKRAEPPVIPKEVRRHGRRAAIGGVRGRQVPHVLVSGWKICRFQLDSPREIQLRIVDFAALW
jgi:hypothetical protein